MPPKRKKKQPTQKQRQSQRQSVVVNIGKTTKRRTTGRGGLPPPSYQHNLAPTFVTAPQVDYVGLIGEISRLTAKVQDPVPIRNPVTPLQSTLQADERMPGIKAELRRAGPTASNFQAQPSKANYDLPEALTGSISDISTLTTASLPVGFKEDESLQEEQAEAFKQQLLKQKKKKVTGRLAPSSDEGD